MKERSQSSPGALVVLAILLAAGAFAFGDPGSHPLEKAKVGQWVLHATHTFTLQSARPTSSYQFVEKVEGRNVHLMTQAVTADGKLGLEPPVPTVVDLDQKLPDDGANPSGEEEIVVKGKKLKCRKLETVTNDAVRGKITTTRWIAVEVPIYGVVKSVTTDKDQKELSRIDLLDYGETGGAARPLGVEKHATDRN